MAEQWGRPNGLFYPPVNPFLRESELPRQRSRLPWNRDAGPPRERSGPAPDRGAAATRASGGERTD